MEKNDEISCKEKIINRTCTFCKGHGILVLFLWLLCILIPSIILTEICKNIC